MFKSKLVLMAMLSTAAVSAHANDACDSLPAEKAANQQVKAIERLAKAEKSNLYTSGSPEACTPGFPAQSGGQFTPHAVGAHFMPMAVCGAGFSFRDEKDLQEFSDWLAKEHPAYAEKVCLSVDAAEPHPVVIGSNDEKPKQ